MATLTAQEWLKLSKETSSYKEQYQNILSYFTQASEQQTEQISQKYSADISGAYANYLSQQRALAEYPGLASGTVARLTEQGLSDYSTAYSAYKAKEAEDIYSASTKLSEKLTTTLGNLDKQASMWAEAAKSLEESVLSYAVGTADEASILGDNDAERLRAYNRILTGATYKGEGTEKQTFQDYLRGQSPDLYDELYYSGYGNELTSILSGISGVNLADTEAVENYARGLEIESLRENLIKDLKGKDLEISPELRGTEEEKRLLQEAAILDETSEEFLNRKNEAESSIGYGTKLLVHWRGQNIEDLAVGSADGEVSDFLRSYIDSNYLVDGDIVYALGAAHVIHNGNAYRLDNNANITGKSGGALTDELKKQLVGVAEKDGTIAKGVVSQHTPPVTKENAQTALKQLVGNRITIEGERYGRAAISVWADAAQKRIEKELGRSIKSLIDSGALRTGDLIKVDNNYYVVADKDGNLGLWKEN